MLLELTVFKFFIFDQFLLLLAFDAIKTIDFVRCRNNELLFVIVVEKFVLVRVFAALIETV